jgi:hypothetical protein
MSAAAPSRPADAAARRATIAIGAWSLLVACWTARGFFTIPPGTVPDTHEGWSYLYRLVEFRDLLAAGYWSPEWATHFRSGLGGPYFGYYQPGFFYVASLVPWGIDDVHALGGAIVLYSLVGFAGMTAFVGSRLGRTHGAAAGTLLLLAPYPGTDLYLRGDLSEYAATMIVPWVFHAFTSALDSGRPGALAGLVLAWGALVVTHPCVALVAGIALAAGWLAFVLAVRDLRAAIRVALALVVGLLLASFYLFPLTFQSQLVQIDRAPGGNWTGRAYLDVLAFLWRSPPGFGRYLGGSFTIGPVLTLLAAATMVARARTHARLVAWLVAVLVVTALLAHVVSAPLWDRLVLIQRLQFPWRVLSVATVAAAALAGAAPVWDRPYLREIAAVVALATLYWLKEPAKPTVYRPVATAADIARTGFFAPDIRSEWLPAGARRYDPKSPPTDVAGDCAIAEPLRRDAARLTLGLAAGDTCTLVLPHYAFPVGWTATLDGGALAIDATADGLMSLAVPQHPATEIVLRFGMTPMRRWGWLATVGTLAAGAAWLARARRLANHAAAP